LKSSCHTHFSLIMPASSCSVRCPRSGSLAPAVAIDQVHDRWRPGARQRLYVEGKTCGKVILLRLLRPVLWARLSVHHYIPVVSYYSVGPRRAMRPQQRGETVGGRETPGVDARSSRGTT